MTVASSARPAETVAERSLAHLVEAGIGPTIVVTGAVTIPTPPGVTVVHNARWADGQLGSVRAAIAAADAMGARRVVVGLADQPGVAPSAWRAVADAGADTPIAVATYAGRRANPVALRADAWPLLPESGDEGARTQQQSGDDVEWVVDTVVDT